VAELTQAGFAVVRAETIAVEDVTFALWVCAAQPSS
jgi:hypothetical protein